MSFTLAVLKFESPKAHSEPIVLSTQSLNSQTSQKSSSITPQRPRLSTTTVSVRQFTTQANAHIRNLTKNKGLKIKRHLEGCPDEF